MSKKTKAAAQAPESTSPDLIVHEWSRVGNGDCINPEVVAIDFGAKGKGRSLAILLGNTGETGWRFGYHATTKDDESSQPVQLVEDQSRQFPTRGAALVAALNHVSTIFTKDKHCSKCISAYFDKIGELPSLINQLAATEGDPVRPPLPKGRFAELPVSAISPNPENHRKHFDEAAAAQLKVSIREHGLLQPIAVRLLSPEEAGSLPGLEAAAGERYEIILGERRWRAHVELKLEVIDAKVYEGVSRAQAKAAALVENLQRQDINAIEEAEGYRDLMAAEDLTQDEVALRVGRSRPAVANAVRLLNLTEKVVEYIRKGELTPAHGIALARFRPKKDEDFPNWRAVVDVIAEEAVTNDYPAGVLEKGVPCQSALERAGLICRCRPYEVGGEFPESIHKHPAYFQEETWCWVCFDPAHWQKLLADHKAETEERAARERERQEAALKKGSKAKLKSLEDLDHRSYRQVMAEEQPEMAELLPESRILDLKREPSKESETVRVCMAPKFMDRVEKTLGELKQADRAAKLPEIFEQARERIRKIRKLDGRVLALVLAAVADSEESAPRFSLSSAKAQGVKLPAALKTADMSSWDRLPGLTTKVLSVMAESSLELVRVLLDDWLCRKFSEDDWDDGQEPKLNLAYCTDDTRAILCHLLELPNLDLLEETKAGRKKLIAAVRALDWYPAALAEAEKNGDMGSARVAATEEEGDGDED